MTPHSRSPSSGTDARPPDVTGMARMDAGPDSSPVTSAGSINILLVDDEPKNLTALETVLDDPEYRLVKAGSADEALLALVAEEFALLVLDIQMPGMNGFELAQMVKQRRKTAGIPIIFLTAYYSEDQHVLEGYSTGAVDYLHKPINAVVLRSKVAVFADLHRKTRENVIANRSLTNEVMERRRVEDQLRELNMELERRVLSRTSELSESEARFRALAENMPHLVWESDAAGRTSYRNARWRLFTGLLQESSESWLAAVHPEDADRVREIWQHCLGTGEEFSAYCRHQRASDGEYRWFHVKAAPVRNPRRKIVKWVGTSTDIHEQRKAEEALRDADRRKDEFLAMLGHELRNPLAAIRHAVRIDQEMAGEPESADWTREVIDRQSSQLARMVDDLLDVERISRGRIELRPVPIDLLQVLRSAEEAIRPLLDQKGHAFASRMEVANYNVLGDAVRLEQVFVNLLNNAVKYTPEGGTIQLSAGLVDGEIMVAIADNGVGITPELLPHVFDLFTQAHTSLDRAQGGLGIGLTVVRSLIEMHGGRVEVDSNSPEQGTTFIVRLPALAEGQVPVPAPALPGPAEPLALRLKVLIVDDHVDAAQTMQRLLLRRNCEVRIEHDGPAGLAAAREFHPDVLLLDLGLPGFDGYELARMLRSDPHLEKSLFIAISGYAQESDLQRSLEAGFEHHFAKPVDFAQLLAQLHGRSASHSAATGN